MYSTFFMYGYQVMRGVIEEKTNRIVEIIIASVRPVELMLGKIIGIGLVGLTQYLVWSLVAMNLSLPAFAGMMSTGDLGVPRVPVSMLGYFILFFLLGYFLYASIYTTIAAPFNTDQEAQQLAMIPMMMIVGGIAVYPAVMNNPTGGVALFFSLFPFTASLIMFLRTAVSEPPAWQILLSIVILISTTAASRGSPAASTASASSCTARSPRSPRSSAGPATPRQGRPARGQAGRLEIASGSPRALRSLSRRERAGVRGVPVAHVPPCANFPAPVWPIRLTVRTRPSQGRNTGSIPVGATSSIPTPSLTPRPSDAALSRRLPFSAPFRARHGFELAPVGATSSFPIHSPRRGDATLSRRPS